MTGLPQTAMSSQWMIDPNAQRTVDFLREIGLSVTIEPGAHGFLETIAIDGGRLFVDPSASASNILHEAAHISIVPSQYRPMMNGDLELSYDRIIKASRFEELDPDSPLVRAILQMGDTEATAWAFAAGRHIGLPDELIIEDHQYDNEGATQRLMLSMGRHVGIQGLQHADFCVARPNPYRPLPTYPQLAMWLQH